jgi:hypothetical protein
MTILRRGCAILEAVRRRPLTELEWIWQRLISALA